MVIAAPIRRVALLEPAVASECVVTEMMGQIRVGTPFLAGSLEQHGITARIFAEELIDFTPSLLDRIPQEYDAVGISTALNTLPRGLQVARALKCRRPNLPIVFGGPSSGAFADKLLTSSDAVLRGRGEMTLPQVLEAFTRGDQPTNVPGAVFRDGARIIRVPGPAPVADGQSRYDLVEGFGPFTVRNGMFGAPKPAIYSLFAGTGCVRHCRFCQSEKRYLARSFDNVIADLRLLLRLHPADSTARIMLTDDCLFADPEWTKELLRRIIHTVRGRSVSFSAQFHVKPTQDNELMKLFREAHFTSLAIGFESVNQESLDAERKGTSVDDNDTAIDQCRRWDIVPYGYFVVGFDTDTRDSVRAVFSYIHRRRLIAQVLPVGIMNRDEQGNPTPEADRVLSDTSFGATVFVSHRPHHLSAADLQREINAGYDAMTSLSRLPGLPTAYERTFLFGLNRCFRVWRPRMMRHVELVQRLTADA